MKKFHITVNGNAYEVEVEEIGGSRSRCSTCRRPRRSRRRHRHRLPHARHHHRY